MPIADKRDRPFAAGSSYRKTALACHPRPATTERPVVEAQRAYTARSVDCPVTAARAIGPLTANERACPKRTYHPACKFENSSNSPRDLEDCLGVFQKRCSGAGMGRWTSEPEQVIERFRHERGTVRDPHLAFG